MEPRRSQVLEVAESMRRRAGAFATEPPILLAVALGWEVTDTGPLECSRATRRLDLIAVAHHSDHRELEARVGHRLCEGELLRAGYQADCTAAWLLLEELYCPDDCLGGPACEDALESLWWAPTGIVEAMLARHPERDAYVRGVRAATVHRIR
jgi:hypothetical protein